MDNHVYDCNNLDVEDYFNLQIPTKYEHDITGINYKYTADVCKAIEKTFPLVIVATTYLITLSNWKWKNYLISTTKEFIDKTGCVSDVCMNIIHTFPQGINQIEAPSYNGPWWGEESFSLIHSIRLDEHLYIDSKGFLLDSMSRNLETTSTIKHLNRTHTAYITIEDDHSRIHVINKRFDSTSQRSCNPCDPFCTRSALMDCVEFGKVQFNVLNKDVSNYGCSLNTGAGKLQHSSFSSYFFPMDGSVYLSIKKTCKNEILYQFNFGNHQRTYVKNLKCPKMNYSRNKRQVNVDDYNFSNKRMQFNTQLIVQYIDGLANQFNEKMTEAYRLLSNVKIDIQHQNIALFRDGLISANILIALELDIPLKSFLITKATNNIISFKKCQKLQMNCTFNPSLFHHKMKMCKSMMCQDLTKNASKYMVDNIVRDHEFFVPCKNSTFWLSKNGLFMVNNKVDGIITVPHFVQTPLYNMHENFYVESEVPLNMSDIYPLNDPSILHDLTESVDNFESNYNMKESWNNVYKSIESITQNKCQHFDYLKHIFYTSLIFFIINFCLMIYFLAGKNIRVILQYFMRWLMVTAKRQEETRENNINMENLQHGNVDEALAFDAENNRESLESLGAFDVDIIADDFAAPLENSIDDC